MGQPAPGLRIPVVSCPWCGLKVNTAAVVPRLADAGPSFDVDVLCPDCFGAFTVQRGEVVRREALLSRVLVVAGPAAPPTRDRVIIVHATSSAAAHPRPPGFEDLR